MHGPCPVQNFSCPIVCRASSDAASRWIFPITVLLRVNPAPNRPSPKPAQPQTGPAAYQPSRQSTLSANQPRRYHAVGPKKLSERSFTYGLFHRTDWPIGYHDTAPFLQLVKPRSRGPTDLHRACPLLDMSFLVIPAVPQYHCKTSFSSWVAALPSPVAVWLIFCHPNKIGFSRDIRPFCVRAVGGRLSCDFPQPPDRLSPDAVPVLKG